MAIGSTAHKLILDSTQFVNGATLSRKELAFLKQTLRETATDTDLMSAGQQKLGELLSKGALTTDQYSRAMDKLKQEVGGPGDPGATGAIDGFLTRLTPTIDVVNLASRAFHLVSDGVRAFSNRVGESIEEIDTLITHSQTLNISAAAFQNIAAAADYADVSVGQAADAVEKMLVAISKGEDKSSRFMAAFELLKVDAAELQRLAPDEAFAKILRGMEGIGNQADRVRVATQIFGQPDALRISAESIAYASEQFERMGGHITALDTERFNQFDQVMKELGHSTESLWRRIALELVPGLNDAAKAAQTLVEGFGGGTAGGIGTVGDNIRGITASVLQLSQTIDTNWDRLSAFAGGASPLLGAAGSILGGIFDANFGEAGRALRQSDELDVRLRELVEARQKLEAFDMDEGEGGTKTPGLPRGRIDRMYEEDRAMDAIVEKYRRRRVELQLSGPFLEIYRAKLDGLKGVELDLFKKAVDKHEMEKLRVSAAEKELKIKEKMRELDLHALQAGSRGAVESLARARFDAFRSGPPVVERHPWSIEGSEIVKLLSSIDKHVAEKDPVEEVTL